MRWSLSAATARQGVPLLVCLLLGVAARLAEAFLLRPLQPGGAVRTFLRSRAPRRPVTEGGQHQCRASIGTVGASVGSAGGSAAAGPRMMQKMFPGWPPREALSARPGSKTTALRALLAPEYDIIHVAGDVVAGFVGGAVGVVGTMVALEVKMRQVNERSKCPYCSGSGQLTCARCYGQQTVSYRTADGQVEQHPCPSCLGTGTVTCINCKGDGLAIPVMLDKKASRDPETRLEEYGMG